MQTLNIPVYGPIRLVSFKPLCATEIGHRAIAKYGYKPFVDFSCRREPDFDNLYPSISALCRKTKLAPHLQEREIVVYLTHLGLYPPYEKKHYRIVAMLQIEKKYQTHQDAFRGYKNLGVTIPRNCIVPGNPALPFDHTASNWKTLKQIRHFLSLSPTQQQVQGQKEIRSWDAYYRSIPSLHKCSVFLRTKPLYLDISNPPVMSLNDYENILGKHSQAPRQLSEKQLQQIGELANLNITFQSEK